MMMGKNIRNARKRIGFTQEELAVQIGVTAQAVSRWESEAGLPDVSMIVPLAQVLRISTDTLFGMNQVEQENDLYMEIKAACEKIESEEKRAADAAKRECDYLPERLESNPVDFVLETCLVERVANLSRYADLEGYLKDGNSKEEKTKWEALAWEDDPETAILFGMWGIRVMETLSEREEILPYCRGFFQNIYKYILKSDLRAEKYEETAGHWNDLKKGIKRHFEYYQIVLENEQEMQKFPERQLGNMRAYTQEFMVEKQEEILANLRHWEGDHRYEKFLDAMEEKDTGSIS